MFDSSMVNEPSGFEPLKFYCIPTCAPSGDSAQPMHSRSLIRIFTGRILDSEECSFFMGTMKILIRLRDYSNLLLVHLSEGNI